MKNYLFILIILNYILFVTSLDPQPIIIPGSINIAFLLDIHSNTEDNKQCTKVNTNAAEQILAAVWTAQLLTSENDSTPKFGFVIYDTCGIPEIATRQVFNLLHRFHKENSTIDTKVPLLGVIGVGENIVLSSVTSLLSAFSIPFVIASPGGRDLDLKVHNILVTSPGFTSQVKPIVSLLKTFQWRSARVISSSSAALNEFIHVIKTADVVMTQSLLVVDGFIDLVGVERILQKTIDEQIIIVVLLSPSELEKLSKILSILPENDAMWLIASPSLARSDIKHIGAAFRMAIFIETHSTNSDKFKSYIYDILTNNTHLNDMEELISAFAENKFNCSWNLNVQNNCKTLPQKSIQSYHEYSVASHIAEAVSALASAYQIMLLDFCPGNFQCADPYPLGPKIMAAMKKLGFSFHKNLQPEFEGVQFRFTESGKLIKTHSHVILYNKSEDPILIGLYSENLGISLNSFAASFTRNQFRTTKYHHIDNFSNWPKEANYQNGISYENNIKRISHNLSNRRPWAAATLILAGLGIISTIYVLVHITVRTYDGTLTGNQTFTILILLSIALLYCTCIIFVFPPNDLMCILRLILHPTAHMICYSLLFVQAIMYKSLSTLDVGGSVNLTHIIITVVALITMQIAIIVEFLLLVKNWTIDSICLTENKIFILLHIPCMTVLFITAIYAFCCRKISKNSQEMVSVLLVSSICLPIWIGWSILIYSAPLRILEPSICAHVLTVTTVILFAMFVPKIRKLSQQTSSFHHKSLSSGKTNVVTIFQPFNSNILQPNINSHKMQIIPKN